MFPYSLVYYTTIRVYVCEPASIRRQLMMVGLHCDFYQKG